MTKLGYRAPLDGLRGLAAAAVVYTHAEFGWSTGGWLGVDVFFVLSGFLITTLLLEEHASRGKINLRQFYIRRSLRLLPALYLLLAVAIALALVTSSPGVAANLRRGVLFAATYTMNFLELTDPRARYLAHTWSLAVEEQFYVIWPLALCVLLRARVRLARIAPVLFAGAVALGGARMTAGDGHQFILRIRPDGVIIGCALALWRFTTLHPERVRGLARLGPVAALALAAVIAGLVPVPEFGGLGPSIAVLAAALVIVHLVEQRAGMLARALSARPLVWLGQVSYGLYLWHPFVFRVLRPYRGDVLRAPWRVGMIAASLLATAISYYAVERPALRLKDRYAQRHRPAETVGERALPPRAPARLEISIGQR